MNKSNNYFIPNIMDFSDSGFQEQSNKAGSSTTNDNTSEKCSNGNIDRHIESSSLNTSKPCIDLTELSSDSGDEDSSYYVTTVWDISDMETLSPSPIAVSSPIYNIGAPCVTVDNTEILEENNNDPNNNLSFVEIPQESSSIININEISKDQTHKTDCSRELRSPIPGCSKDVDITDNSKAYNLCHKMHKEAVLISTLLPNIEFDLIVKTMKKNQYAKNYIELTLLDLLHKKKPIPQVLPKRKQIEDICLIERKRSSPKEFGIVSDEVQTNNTDLTETSGTVSVKQEEYLYTNEPTNSNSLDSCKENIEKQSEEYNLPIVKDTCLDKTCNLLTNNSKSDNNSSIIEVYNGKDTMPEVQEKETVNNAESKTLNTHSLIIRPAKLIVPKSAPILQPQLVAYTATNVVLAPSKLSFISNYEEKVTNNDTSLSPVKNVVPMEFTNKINTHRQNDNINEGILNTTMNNTTQKSIFYETEIPKNCLSSDSGIHSTFSNNINEVNSDTTSDLVSSSVSVLKNADANKDNKILIHGPDISEQSTKFVPSFNNDLNLPSTSKDIMKGSCINVATNLESLQEESSIIVLPTISTTNDRSVFEFGETQESTLSAVTATEIPKTSTQDIKLSPKMERIYYKLLPIFPHVNPNYIKTTCAVKDILETNVEESVQLHILIEELLVSGNLYPRIVNIEPEPTEAICDVTEQYENILGIFPDADPIYLRDIVEKIYNKPEELKSFVQSKLESHDYPTREQYLEKTKVTEQQKQYTTEFRIDKFLKIFPDPFSYFENPQRRYTFNSVAYEFLKHHYNKLRVSTILHVYWSNNHHLSLTAKALDNFQPDMKGKRTTSYLPTKDIPLLQEITFIRHRSEIETYLKKLKEEEAREFQKLKENNGLLECQCCYDNECMPSKCSSCDSGHIFCNACITKGTEMKLAESETHIYCFLNCTKEISLSVLQKVLSPTTFSILLQKRQEAEVAAAGLEGLVSCPFCYFASIPPMEDKVFKCFNPDCMKETCRLCKELNHVPLSCDEANSEKARHYLEEKMTEALIHTCYKCSRPFFKEEGCNKMTCVCGAEMCYICDKPVNGYKHFRGQGSTQTDLCPLWSDNHVINAKAVLQVAQETEKDIKKKNPNVKLVTKSLLPSLPCKSKGPHEDIPHSDVIPARAYNIRLQK